PDINRLSKARLFLFGARDMWFVIALPLYFSVHLGWEHAQIGGFMAAWLIGYGVVQATAPSWVRIQAAAGWSWALAGFTAALAIAVYQGAGSSLWLVTGLLIFGTLFAINSAVHSYAITELARSDGASLDVGFYYMANAAGRLIGTVLSGAVYQGFGLWACLAVSALMLAIAAWDARRVWPRVITDGPTQSV
ncbi:MAG: hypothetical protein ACPGUF_00145, partial [Litorivicinus sp.]